MTSINWQNLNWNILNGDSRPFFIYNLTSSREFLNKVEAAFLTKQEQVKINFSVKSNPQLHVIKSLADTVDGFDVSSELELRYLLALKIDPKRISFSGPGKTDAALKLASEAKIKVVQLDSPDELAMALKFNLKNLSFRIHHDELFSSKLGFTESSLDFALKNLRQPAMGLHIYLGRESFTQERFEWAMGKMAKTFAEHAGCFSEPTMFIGPGFSGQVAAFPVITLNHDYPVELEVGRGIVAQSGFYVAQVMSRKLNERGSEVLIINGGLQHLGGPYLTAMQKMDELKVEVLRDSATLNGSHKEFTIAGSLCLGHDILHPRLMLPESISRGDWIVFPQSGGYGLTAGVPYFIGQDLPREFIIENNQIQDITVNHFKLYQDSF